MSLSPPRRARQGVRGSAARRGAQAAHKSKSPRGHVAAVPPAGCALVSPELLQHLRKEVGSSLSPGAKATAVTAVQDAASPPAAAAAVAASPVRKRVPAENKLPGLHVPAAGNYLPLIVSHAHDEADGPPPPPGACHASVGTVDAVEEGTQTGPDQAAGAAEGIAAVAPILPASALQPSLLSPLAGQSNVSPTRQAPTVSLQGLDASQGLAVAMPQSGAESPHGHGRYDLFYVDRTTAEREKERKRLQAQMLMDQIQEQKERKEEEQRRKHEEDVREEQRLERERREIEERHQREQAELAAKAAAAQAPEESAVQKEAARRQAAGSPGPGHTRRRQRSKDENHPVSPAGHRTGGTYINTASDMTGAGPWVEGEERRRRRRRRRREMTEEGSWRTSEQKRSWRDPHLDSLSLRMPGGRDTESPVPWLSTGGQQDGLSTVQESEEMKRTEARRTRRRRRDRDTRDHHDRRDSVEGFEDEGRREREAHDRGLQRERGARWARGASEDDEEEPRLRRRGGRSRRSPTSRREEQAVGSETQASAIAERERPNAYHKPGLLSPKLTMPSSSPLRPSSEAELREQLGSLVRVCEELLRKRAEERERSAADWRPPLAPASHRPAGVGLSAEADGAHVNKSSHQARPGGHGGHSYGLHHAGGGMAPATGNAERVSDMNSWGGEDIIKPSRQTVADSPEPWPPDALVELLQGEPHSPPDISGLVQEVESWSERATGASSAVPNPLAGHSALAAGNAPAAAFDRGVAGHPSVPGQAADSPFSPPGVRGLALRRSSADGRQHAAPGGLRSPPAPGGPGGVFSSRMASPGWGGRLLAGPAPVSRGGLNVQANWEPLGMGPVAPLPGNQGGPVGVQQWREAPEKPGPGHVPIGIKPSIQAQSAMLREMYPNAAAGSGLPGPLAMPPGGIVSK
eukprot:TRINITY_DN49069_c0_g1_i1.p1 TRINITY_DN49069_c0_g1~~TRINITY_DN49069_c0_g1_i1.p1  ORF type:complete len:963 (-),score=170.03 TRINITY_DN49069_c0_g1_i1:9-2762(-)